MARPVSGGVMAVWPPPTSAPRRSLMYARRRSTTLATAVGTRLVHRAMAIGGTLMVLTTMATSAQAADGQFPYSRFDTGAGDALFHPPNDTCLPLPGGATHAGNDTDATAFVYAD